MARVIFHGTNKKRRCRPSFSTIECQQRKKYTHLAPSQASLVVKEGNSRPLVNDYFKQEPEEDHCAAWRRANILGSLSSCMGEAERLRLRYGDLGASVRANSIVAAGHTYVRALYNLDRLDCGGSLA